MTKKTVGFAPSSLILTNYFLPLNEALYAWESKSMKLKIIGRELVVAFILGGIPCLIAFERGGVVGIENYLRAIDTSDTTVYYFAVLALAHFLVSHLGYWSPRSYEKVKKLFHSTYPVLNEVGSSLVCLYRVITGAILACGVVGVTYFPILGELKYPLILLVLATPSLWISITASESYNNAKSKQI